MPTNIRWYPNELPALAQSSSSTSALEASVRSLQNDARIAAIRQALGRRSSGVIAAAQQNTGVIVISSLMPLVIDPVTRSQPATQTVSSVGTVGFVSGSSSEGTARSVDRVTFATDAVASLGDKFAFARRQRGGASRLTTGLVAGGGTIADPDNGQEQIEEFTYSTEAATTLPSVLPFRNFPYSGGFGGMRAPNGFASATQAYFAATGEPWGFTPICRIGFDTKTVSLLGVSVQVFQGAAVGSPSAALIFPDKRNYGNGGVFTFQYATETASYDGSPQTTSGDSRQALGNGGASVWLFGGPSAATATANYRFTVATRTFSQIGSNLPVAIVNAARVGNSTQGYLCGGTAGPIQYWNSWFTNTGLSPVYKFVYATETVSTNANSLTTTRSHPIGISNYSGAFFGQ